MSHPPDILLAKQSVSAEPSKWVPIKVTRTSILVMGKVTQRAVESLGGAVESLG